MISYLDADVRKGMVLVFKGTRPHWFTNQTKNAEDNLVVGNTYHLNAIRVASSSTTITLDETGDLEYSLSWFDRE